MGRTLLALLVVFLASAAEAHFPMLLPSPPLTRKGDAIALTYQWGHPFEHQLFDAPAALSLTVRAPDGKRNNVTSMLEKTMRPTGDKKVTAYELKFTPEERGDYVFVLRVPPVWMEEDGEYLEDTAQVVLHVQGQRGWDKAPEGLGWQLLTRPYGLLPGMVFQAQAREDGKPLAGAAVEIEHYSPTPPAELPADEHITRTARTDPNGVVTTTLSEAGWWCVTVAIKGADREHDSKNCSVRRRAVVWVFVDERPGKG
jgi:uncharacterized GH25 family protein